MDDIDKLKPSPETDKLVADAIGIEYDLLGNKVYRYPYSGGASFNPSRDLNDAFEAAEKIYLFQFEANRLTQKLTLWFVGEDTSTTGLFVSASTPAMAICKAILTLKAK